MGNENRILTALGLDTSQFETGTDRAAGKVKTLTGALALAETELRKIPLVGQLYSATFGRIVDGFAETREQAREFARIMRTDVSGSLDGSIQQIDDLNDSLRDLKVGSFGRAISDKLSDLNRGFSSLITGKPVAGESASDKRARMIREEEQKRAEVLQTIGSLARDEAQARSAAMSGSELITEQQRIQLRFAREKLRIEQEADRLAGPEGREGNEPVMEAMNAQIAAAEELRGKENDAAVSRMNVRREELIAAATIADLQVFGNERDIAAAEEKLALVRLEEAERLGIVELIERETANASIARSNAEAAQIAYDNQALASQIMTQQLAAHVTGQTRLAKQVEIRARYEIQIANALREGRTELAKQLSAQEKLSQLEEAIRQYELGGRGRARERAEERRRARIARTVGARLADREDNDGIGNQAGESGLQSGGLRASGGLSRPVKSSIVKPQVEVGGMKEFADKLFSLLEK